jgi:outer membrane autotransporter protein
LRTTSLGDPTPPLTINVGGNYTQTGGILQLGISGRNGSQYDRIQAQGTASVGGALQVFGLKYIPVNGNAFAVVRANGGRIRGTRFSTINDEEFNLRGLRRVDLYLRNAVVLLYLNSHVPPGPEPEPGPQPPDVNPPEPPTKEPPAIDEEEDNVVLPPVDPNDPVPLPEEVQLVDPTAEELTALYQIGFSAANMQRFNLGDRMFQIQQSVVPTPEPVPPPISPGKEIEGKGVEEKAPPPAPPPSPINRWGAWANSWGDFVNLDSTSAALGYRFTTFGISAGVDYLIIPDHFAVGLFGGYSHTWINFTPSGSSTANTGRGGLYATYFNQGWWVDVAGWGGGTNYSTSRQALAGTANAETSGWEVSTYGEAGYDFHWNDLSFGPTVAMQYTNVHLNGFGENGSLVPLQIHSDSQDSLVTDVGGRAYYKFHVSSIPVIPTVRLAWEHEYFYSNLLITATAPALNGATATFSGPAEGHDSLIINAGISVQWTPRIWTTIGYDGQVARNHYNSNAVTGTFSFSF